MWILATGIGLGTCALIALIRAIERAIYYGTAPPPTTDITHESTNISRDRGRGGAGGVSATAPAPHDRRDLPRIATFR
jgi:hypothetical protein